MDLAGCIPRRCLFHIFLRGWFHAEHVVLVACFGNSFEYLLTVQIGSEAKRNTLKFGLRPAESVAKQPARTVVFEHVDGCQVCMGLYSHFRMPNGRLGHFFDKVRAVFWKGSRDVQEAGARWCGRFLVYDWSSWLAGPH